MADYLKIPLTSQILEKIYGSGIITAIIVCFLMMLLLLWKFTKKNYRLPPGPTGVPLLGYLPFFGPEPFRDLDKLKEKYGNVFSLYMGPKFVVILGDYEAVKEAFSKSETTDRPPKLFDFLPDGVGFSGVNGQEWADQRRFCVRTMRVLGVGKNKWESTIQAEVEDFVNLVSSSKGQPVDIFDPLTSSISNNIMAFVFGSRLPYDHPDRKLLDATLDDVMECFDQAALYNFFPIIRNLQVALGIGKAAKVYRKLEGFNNFVRKAAEKMKMSYKTGEHENFIVDYLKVMESSKNKPECTFNDTNLHGNTQALFLGGSDTTRNSVHWLLLILAEHTRVQERIYREVYSILGKDGRIQWSERKKLPFTVAVIMEAQRWRTIAPINTARVATKDIKVQGYDIPMGTTILANNWGLHHDQRYWKDPEKFYPERFLTEDGDEVRTKIESYNPFSYGKRNCPGETIAMMEILLYLTALVQKFTIMAPKAKKINFDGKMGLNYKANKQDLIFVL